MPKAPDGYNVDTRYSFTGQFLEASAMFVRDACDIEANSSTQVADLLRVRHRGLISAAIMQCAAALETEAHEICVHGPRSHLGSSASNLEALQMLKPFADVIDSQSTMRRFELILRLLRKPPMTSGTEPTHSAALVVRLRNELIHYKSLWGAEMASRKLFGSLKALNHRPPPFIDPTQNFFPHQCLSAACGKWALRAVVDFLEAFYVALGVPSRFATYAQRLVV